MTIFIDNKYTKWYYSIISNAKSKKNLSRTERHHIIPDCFFINRKRKGKPGTITGNPNENNNLIMLTLREHYLCHLLLTKMTTGHSKRQMICAFKFLCLTNSDIKLTNRIFEYIRSNSHEAHSVFATGKKHTEETKKILHDQRIGIPRGPHKIETKQKISDSLKNIPKAEEHRKNIDKANKDRCLGRPGPTHSDATKQKMRKPKSKEHALKIAEANKLRAEIPFTELQKERMSLAKINADAFLCPHCNKSAKAGMFSRWHGNNCKLKNL